MADDLGERACSGRLRDMQNWVGGSDHSPRNALYVPPPPETVEPALADLLHFANRDDMPALGQAAIAHAQFESIHPFTDGNGRVGRALVNAVLRRRGVTTSVVVPLASALVARRDDYFETLGAYRAGDAERIVAAFADAATVSSTQAAITGRRIAELPTEWAEVLGTLRGGSASSRLFTQLSAVPVFTAEEAVARVGGAASSVYAAIERFATAGVIRPLTERRRNQVWGVGDMLDELEDLNDRIAAEVRGSAS